YVEQLRGDLDRAVKCCDELKERELGKAASYLRLPPAHASFYFRLRAGSLPLEVEVGRYHRKAREERHCKICGSQAVEDTVHFVASCKALEKERTCLFESVEPLIPEGTTLQTCHLLGKPMGSVTEEQL